jgi:anti-sigma regulatory factor (Ser/Thr protein kinase)
MDIRRSLTADVLAPSAARRVVDEAEVELGADRAQDVRLLVSELVTNSVRHSGTPDGPTIGLRLSTTPSLIRIEVEDQGSWRPPRPDPTNTSGWGFHLMDRLVDRWGVEDNGGTRVWFEIDRRRANPPDRRRPAGFRSEVGGY